MKYGLPEILNVYNYAFTDHEIKDCFSILKTELNMAAEVGNGVTMLEFMAHPYCIKTMNRDLALRHVAFLYGRVWSYSPQKKIIKQIGRAGLEWIERMGELYYDKDGELYATVIIDKNAEVEDGYVETYHFNVNKLECFARDFYHHK